MKTFLAIPMGICALAMTAPANAEPFAVMGIGMMVCTDVPKFMGEYPENEGILFMWAQGFMSGANAMRVSANTPFRDLHGDVKAQMASLKQYCAAHPQETYAKAVGALYNGLPFANFAQ